jgi:hypothetical protein
MAVAENPAQAYNRFSYTAAWDWARLTCCMPSEITPAVTASRFYMFRQKSFTNDLINAIRTHSTQAFREPLPPD